MFLDRSRAPLRLSRLRKISRPLSVMEHYHAAIGTHPRTLERQREVTLVLEGDNQLQPAQWQKAIQQVAAANPGSCLRLRGCYPSVHLCSDGPPPQLRVIEGCDWDGRSSQGAEFLHAPALSLENGPTVELILARRAIGDTLLVLRTPHAIMDACGAFHFLQELFRALRGEPLLGSNAGFSDVDLMLSTGARYSTSRHIPTTWLTGTPEGDELGDDWRRIELGVWKQSPLAPMAEAFAEFAHRYSDLPALIAVPVNLRRHSSGLLATTNFSNILFVRLERGDGADVFRSRLDAMLAQRMDAVYPRILGAFKWLPGIWLDLLVSRTLRNYRDKKPLETAVITNLGRIDSRLYSGPGFNTRRIFVVPLPGSAFASLTCTDGQLLLAINLPRVLSNNGRFDALEAHLRQRLTVLH
jgi:hypothetical protein